MIAVNKTQFSFFCSAYLGSVLPNSLGWFVGWHHRRILRFYYLIENVLRGLFSNNLAYLTSQHRSNQSLTEFNLLSVTCKWPSFLSSTIVLLKHSISWSLNSSFGTHGFQNGAKESKLRKNTKETPVRTFVLVTNSSKFKLREFIQNKLSESNTSDNRCTKHGLFTWYGSLSAFHLNGASRVCCSFSQTS